MAESIEVTAADAVVIAEAVVPAAILPLAELRFCITPEAPVLLKSPKSTAIVCPPLAPTWYLKVLLAVVV